MKKKSKLCDILKKEIVTRLRNIVRDDNSPDLSGIPDFFSKGAKKSGVSEWAGNDHVT